MKIAMFGYKQNYIYPFLDFQMATDKDFECRFYGHGVKELDFVSEWADIVWVEWAHPKVLSALFENLSSDLKIVIRANGMDIVGALNSVELNWSRSHLLIVPSPTIWLSIQPLVSDLKINVIQIPHPIDTRVFIPDIDKKFGRKALYHGRINKQECVVELVKQFSKSLWTLTVVGIQNLSNPNEYTTQVLEVAEKSDNIHLVEWIDDRMVHSNLLSGHDIVLSANPGFQKRNVSVLEGMACGLYPVIFESSYTRLLFEPKYLVPNLVKGANDWQKNNITWKRKQRDAVSEYVQENFAASLIAPQILGAIGV